MEQASSFPTPTLVSLINKVFRDYSFLINETKEGFVARNKHNDIALEHSPVALVDDAAVGFALLGLRGSRAWLGGMGVIPEYRRLGIGQTLVENVMDKACDCSSSLCLEVIEKNHAAISLYEKMGFVEKRKLWCFRKSRRQRRDRMEGLMALDLVSLAKAYDPDHCWQKSFTTTSRLERLEAFTLKNIPGSYAVVSRKEGKLEIWDVSPPSSLVFLLEALGAGDVRAINVHNESLAREYKENGFHDFAVQREMLLDLRESPGNNNLY